jgi:uncharacterized protein YbbK (DUF523 family)
MTDALWKFGQQTARGLSGISGYIFKAHSPSCGLAGVPVFSREAIGPGGEPIRGPIGEARGLFAAAIVESLPGLPVAEEGGLRDAAEREDFLLRVFAYARGRGLPAEERPG